MPARGCIEEGSVVLIMRTDGRVQSGVLRSVLHPRRVAIVEWDEDGERRGKAVGFLEIFALNAFKHQRRHADDDDNDERASECSSEKINTIHKLRNHRKDTSEDSVRPTKTPTIPDKNSRAIFTPRISTANGRKTATKANTNNVQAPIPNDTPKPAPNIRPTNITQRKSSGRSSLTSRNSTLGEKIRMVVPRKKARAQSKPDAHARRAAEVSASRLRPASLSVEAGLQMRGKMDTSMLASSLRKVLPAAVVDSPETTTIRATFRLTGDRAKLDPAEDRGKKTIEMSNQYTVSEGMDAVVQSIRNMEKHREEQRSLNSNIRADKEYRKSMNKNWELIQMIENYRRTLDRSTTLPTEIQHFNKISVYIRKRPLSIRELNREEVDILTVPNGTHIVAHELKQKVDGTKYIINQCFRFDYVFDGQCSNKFVYERTAKPLVMMMLNGGRATCFAYGQTGTGKTHTMGGAARNEEDGIYALVANDVFYFLAQPEFKSQNLMVVASYYEIYCTKIYDLLKMRAQLNILEDRKGKLNICHISEIKVSTSEDVMKLIHRGNQARSSGKTSANENSSRSHAVFQLSLQSRMTSKQVGVFSLIDLAGNERGSDSTAKENKTKQETGEINKSLLILKDCIRAMGNESEHLPFRNSKLTHVLRDSFIGDKIQTCMIATVSPGNESTEHSIDTLKYADRVKGLLVRDSKILGQKM